MRKYILTDEAIIYKGHTLHRIRAVRDFQDVKTGQFGGYIESEENLSHDGNCWVYDNAKVYEKARVLKNAKVYGCATVSGHAAVTDSSAIRYHAMIFGHAVLIENATAFGFSKIGGNAIIRENASVHGRSIVYGSTVIGGNAEISDLAKIYTNIFVFDNVHIYGNAIIKPSSDIERDRLRIRGFTRIGNNAKIESTRNIVCIGPLGSRNDFTTFYKSSDNDIWVSCGCFTESIKDFEHAVRIRHSGTRYFDGYMRAITYAKEALR